MLYEDQARKLAEAINHNWRELSRMMDDDREEALASICHDILQYGSAGFSIPFKPLTHSDIEAMVRKMLNIPPPQPPQPPERKNLPPRDPNKPYEPWELNQGDEDTSEL